MFYNDNWLQVFADGASGGDGGTGAATGVSPGDAGRDTGVAADDAGQRLEELGVPPEKAEAYRQRKQKTAAPAAPAEETAKPENEAPTAENKGIEWDEFMQRPENQQRMQRMMAERGRTANEIREKARAEQERLRPMNALLADFYGIKTKEDGTLDLEAIVNAVLDDDRFYEKYADEMGVSNDVGKRMYTLERDKAESRRAEEEQTKAQAQARRDEELRQYFYGVAKQAREMKTIYPDFDLQAEMRDPEFFRMIDPEGGRMRVRQAYWAKHGDELAQRQAEAMARQIKTDVAASVRAGQSFPRENGGGSTAAVSSTPNLRGMSREERRAYIINKYGRG